MKKTYIMKTVCAVGLTAACAWGLAGCSSDDNASSGTGGVAGTVNGVEIAEDTITNSSRACASSWVLTMKIRGAHGFLRTITPLLPCVKKCSIPTPSVSC